MTAERRVAPEELDRAVECWARAEHDFDDAELLRLLADDVVMIMVGPDHPDLRGREAVAAWYREQAANVLHERDLPVQRVHGWACVLDDVVRESRVTGTLYGLRGEGRRARYRLRRLFELSQGRIGRLTEWPDMEALARQLP